MGTKSAFSTMIANDDGSKKIAIAVLASLSLLSRSIRQKFSAKYLWIFPDSLQKVLSNLNVFAEKFMM
jgi:hypothetical protein